MLTLFEVPQSDYGVKKEGQRRGCLAKRLEAPLFYDVNTD